MLVLIASEMKPAFLQYIPVQGILYRLMVNLLYLLVEQLKKDQTFILLLQKEENQNKLPAMGAIHAGRLAENGLPIWGRKTLKRENVSQQFLKFQRKVVKHKKLQQYQIMLREEVSTGLLTENQLRFFQKKRTPQMVL